MVYHNSGNSCFIATSSWPNWSSFLTTSNFQLNILPLQYMQGSRCPYRVFLWLDNLDNQSKVTMPLIRPHSLCEIMFWPELQVNGWCTVWWLQERRGPEEQVVCVITLQDNKTVATWKLLLIFTLAIEFSSEKCSRLVGNKGPNMFEIEGHKESEMKKSLRSRWVWRDSLKNQPNGKKSATGWSRLLLFFIVCGDELSSS